LWIDFVKVVGVSKDKLGEGPSRTTNLTHEHYSISVYTVNNIRTVLVGYYHETNPLPDAR